MTKPVWVMTDQLLYAKHRWTEVDTSPRSAFHFELFMGFNTYGLNDRNQPWSLNVSQKTGDRMFLLLGPHYRAIIKAYLIKHGKDHENTKERTNAKPQTTGDERH